MTGYYEFFSRVNIVAGFDALDRTPALLGGLQSQKPMIIADRGVAGAGLIDVLMLTLNGVDIVGIQDDVPADSDTAAVKRIAEMYRRSQADGLIAVGGGSVMDTAKAVNMMVSHDADDLLSFCGADSLKRPLKPLVAIPTTAGTGSEVTRVAVIFDPERRQKMIFSSPFLLPDAAVLDPRMTETLPAHLTAQTAMDALTHAMEAYTCLGKNPVSDRGAYAAVELISGNLLKVVRHPQDRRGRLALAVAAALAGMAFSNAMVGMVHTLGHAVGAVCRVPHGACMAIFLPYGFEYNLHKNADLTAQLLLPLAGADVFVRTPAHQRALKVIEGVRRLNDELHEATDGKHARFLKEVLGPDGAALVPRQVWPEVAATAVNDGSLFYNPEDLDEDDCLTVLEAAWEGKALDPSQIKKG
jgi:alcohol dehydrogenase